jgi:hypothetical protein
MATEARPRAFHFGALVYPVSIVSVAMVSAEYQTQQRGVFMGVVDLQAAINRFVVDHNQQPKPFVWTVDPDKIIAPLRAGTECWLQSANRWPWQCGGPTNRRAECPLSGWQPRERFDP